VRLDLSEDVSQLEQEIEQLASTVENCRRIVLLSKVMIGFGFAWLVALVLGAISFGRLSVLSAISMVVFGIVAYGSNLSTLRQSQAALREVEARRAMLIASMDLQPIEPQNL
jgi:hypothetical protein